MKIPESSNIQSTSNLILIGDLDGSYANFTSFTQQSRCMDNYGRWTGGNQTVIFSGDILADRNPDGFRILEAIRYLRRDAQRVGGDIVVLAGNHEEVMLGFLLGDNLNVGSDTSPHNVKNGSPFYGLSELIKYGDNREQIIGNMRTDEAGKKSLEDICELKLMHRIGNSLHFHTPPSKQMLDILAGFYNKIGNLDESIDYINQQWKITLRTKLLGEKFSPIETTKIKKIIDENIIYTLFRNSFLQTANGSPEGFKKRVQGSIFPGGLTEDSAQQMLNNMEHNTALTPPTHPMYELLRTSGIDTVCHGHDSSVGKIDGFNVVGVNRRWQMLAIQEKTGVSITNILSSFPEFPDKYSICTFLLEIMKTMPDSLRLGKIRIDWSHLPNIVSNRRDFIQYCNTLLRDEKGATFQFSDTGETLRFELILPDDWRESTPINPQNSIQELIQTVRTAKKNH